MLAAAITVATPGSSDMTMLLLGLLLLLQTGTPALDEALLEAARRGDAAQVASLLDKGANVNAKARYGVTPLIFAATNGHITVVRLLVSRGADVNAQDSFYQARAADMALSNGHVPVGIFLLQNGSQGADAALLAGVQAGNVDLVNAALSGTLPAGRQSVQTAIAMANAQKRAALVPVLEAALAARPAAPGAPAFSVDPATLQRYAGTYRDGPGGATGLDVNVTVQGGSLVLQVTGQPPLPLVPKAEDTFGTDLIPNFTATFRGPPDTITSLTIVQGPATVVLARANTTVPPPAAAAPSAAEVRPSPAPAAAPAVRPRNWPSFRGTGASGNADGQGAVSEWDVASGRNIKWKTPIPGIANSSPIVWDDRVFATTATSKAGDTTFRTGNYGDVKPVDDLSEHQWKIYCLDRTTGKVLWERVAFTGVPNTRRHTKGTQANSTPVTDGARVVAAFGSAGVLVAWDMNGRQLWRADLGTLDSGWFFDPTYQWGHASSPIIHRGTVILQADIQKGSYLAAWDLATGKQVWKTLRQDEISTWGTPAVVQAPDGREEIVTNGTKVRGYDARTGELLWTLSPNSEITVATPVSGHGFVFVTGGYPPVRPIYAIRPGARGDIALARGQTSSSVIPWSNTTDGTYIPTPIVYGDHLITLNNNGVVSAYDARTGQRAYRGRIGTGGAFSASPVAADGRLYVASEDGEIYVVTAGPGLAEIAKNDMNEVVMATPAISGGLIVVRTLGHLYGIGR
jgi:outer membrane protein assembly factor BamB